MIEAALLAMFWLSDSRLSCYIIGQRSFEQSYIQLQASFQVFAPFKSETKHKMVSAGYKVNAKAENHECPNCFPILGNSSPRLSLRKLCNF